MKIFTYDFKTGRRGNHVADMKLSGLDCRIGMHKDTPVHASMNVIIYVNDEPTWSSPLMADNFAPGIEAITFCSGQDLHTEKWEWYIVPTSTIVDKAITRNMERFGTAHMKVEVVA